MRRSFKYIEWFSFADFEKLSEVSFKIFLKELEEMLKYQLQKIRNGEGNNETKKKSWNSKIRSKDATKWEWKIEELDDNKNITKEMVIAAGK